MYVVTIYVEEREESASKIQEILTQYGENIMARLGLNDSNEERNSVILVVYQQEDVKEFVKTLKMIKGIRVNYMEI